MGHTRDSRITDSSRLALLNFMGAVALNSSLLMEAGLIRFAPEDLGLFYSLAALIFAPVNTFFLVKTLCSRFSSAASGAEDRRAYICVLRESCISTLVVDL